jgi:hypothetical protein
VGNNGECRAQFHSSICQRGLEGLWGVRRGRRGRKKSTRGIQEGRGEEGQGRGAAVGVRREVMGRKTKMEEEEEGKGGKKRRRERRRKERRRRKKKWTEHTVGINGQATTPSTVRVSSTSRAI